ncbi:hypothetical protein HYH03_014219 [Edaphochlamys debaryana]|uniref:Uncharacterized protein n=1 Tax=Edaphochlamys debaryana TaxID=47281 RepID=A0A836BS48_9CHLO|nr:hypothetical protein HYH03_014219 [Edaphochlamys debaryana]|eukprot:KAG2487106.1 hypothetical protein HYH03_014219 [Edaphochlamys debaryana]
MQSSTAPTAGAGDATSPRADTVPGAGRLAPYATASGSGGSSGARSDVQQGSAGTPVAALYQVTDASPVSGGAGCQSTSSSPPKFPPPGGRHLRSASAVYPGQCYPVLPPPYYGAGPYYMPYGPGAPYGGWYSPQPKASSAGGAHVYPYGPPPGAASGQEREPLPGPVEEREAPPHSAPPGGDTWSMPPCEAGGAPAGLSGPPPGYPEGWPAPAAAGPHTEGRAWASPAPPAYRTSPYGPGRPWPPPPYASPQRHPCYHPYPPGHAAPVPPWGMGPPPPGYPPYGPGPYPPPLRRYASWQHPPAAARGRPAVPAAPGPGGAALGDTEVDSATPIPGTDGPPPAYVRPTAASDGGAPPPPLPRAWHAAAATAAAAGGGEDGGNAAHAAANVTTLGGSSMRRRSRATSIAAYSSSGPEHSAEPQVMACGLSATGMYGNDSTAVSLPYPPYGEQYCERRASEYGAPDAAAAAAALAARPESFKRQRLESAASVPLPPPPQAPQLPPIAVPVAPGPVSGPGRGPGLGLASAASMPGPHVPLVPYGGSYPSDRGFGPPPPLHLSSPPPALPLAPPLPPPLPPALCAALPAPPGYPGAAPLAAPAFAPHRTMPAPPLPLAGGCFSAAATPATAAAESLDDAAALAAGLDAFDLDDELLAERLDAAADLEFGDADWELAAAAGGTGGGGDAADCAGSGCFAGSQGVEYSGGGGMQAQGQLYAPAPAAGPIPMERVESCMSFGGFDVKPEPADASAGPTPAFAPAAAAHVTAVPATGRAGQAQSGPQSWALSPDWYGSSDEEDEALLRRRKSHTAQGQGQGQRRRSAPFTGPNSAPSRGGSGGGGGRSRLDDPSSPLSSPRKRIGSPSGGAGHGAATAPALDRSALPASLPPPVRVTVAGGIGLARIAQHEVAGGGGGHGHDATSASCVVGAEGDADGGAAAAAVGGRVVGRFVPAAYLEGGKCIEFRGQLVSRSAFERAGGSAMAKWHRSIKVLPDGTSLGKWLARHGLPVLKGNPRRSGKQGAAGDEEDD